jgi:hypothetical protein
VQVKPVDGRDRGDHVDGAVVKDDRLASFSGGIWATWLTGGRVRWARVPCGRAHR